MNTPVSFEIAKFLKEKGWNTFTSSFWKCPNEVPSLHTGVFNYNNRVKEDGTELPAYSAPTIAEVVMWLYEKHEIWISVDTFSDAFKAVIKKYYSDGKLWVIADSTYISKYHNSPTDAYEAAIEYTLNHLM